MLLLLPDEVARHLASLVAFADLQAIAGASREARASLYGESALERSRLVLLPSNHRASCVVASCSAHPRCRALQRVSLTGLTGVEMIVDKLPHVSSVTYEAIKNAPDDCEGLVSMVSQLRQLQKLHLRGVHSIDLAPFAGLNLEELSIQRSAHVKNISTIASFSDLRVLDLEGTTLQDIHFVGSLKKLTTLNVNTLASIPLPINLEPLQSLRRLETLVVDAHELPDVSVFDSFASTLKHLSCDSVTWPQGNNAWDQLLQKLPELVSLCGSDLDFSFTTLANLKHLQSLEMNVPDTLASLEALPSLPRLASCTIHPKSRGDHVRLSRLSSAALECITSISITDLAGDDPSETEDVGQCYRYLATLPSLRHARFTGHPFCAKWVRLPRQLEKLQLQFVGESWWGWDEFPSEILRNAKQLRRLSIESTQPWAWDLSVLDTLPTLESFQLLIPVH